MNIFTAVIISLLFNLQARAELVFKQDGEVVSSTVLAGKGVDVDIEVSGEAEKIYRATRASGLSIVSDTCGLKQFASDSCIITVNSQNTSGQLTFKYQDPSRRIKILKFSFIEAGDNLEVRSGAVNGQIDLGLLENNVSLKKIITLKNSGGTTLNLSMDLANTSVSFLNNSCLGELAPAKECKFTIEVNSSGLFEGGNAISVKNNGTELLNIPVLFEVSNEEPTDEFAAEPEKSLDEECLANATTAQEALKCSLSGAETEDAVLSIKDLNCDETNTCTQNMEYQSKAFPIILDITLIYKDIIERACVVDDLRIKGLVLDSVIGASGIVSGTDISGCLVSACEVGFDVAPDSLSCLPAGVELCTLANANEGGVILTGEVLSVEGVLPSCSVTSCSPLFDIAGDQKSCVAQTRACTLADAQVNGADITSAISAAGTVSAADVSQCVISTCEAEFSVAGDQKSCQANAVACTLANANEGGVILTSEVLAVSGDLPSCSVTQCAPLFDIAGDQKSCVAQTRACTLADAQSNGADILNAFSAVGTVSAADVSQCVIGACNENYNVAGDQKSCEAVVIACSESDAIENGVDMLSVSGIKGSVVAGDVSSCLVDSCSDGKIVSSDQKSCDDDITFEPTYSDYGTCSASQPCSGSGYQNRTITSCQKFINGEPVSGGVVSDCSDFNNFTYLRRQCYSPAGERTVTISNGSQDLYCNAGSYTFNATVLSVTCNEGYEANAQNQCVAPYLPQVPAQKISVGLNNACLVTMDNKVYCNINGNGSVYLPEFDGAKDVAVSKGSSGSNSICAIMGDNRVKCKSSTNYFGEIGVGTQSPSPTATVVTAFGFAKKIQFGGTHFCVIPTSGNQLKCAGSNLSGELGISNPNGYATTPVTSSSIPGTLLDLHLGTNVSCVSSLVSGSVRYYCSGAGISCLNSNFSDGCASGRFTNFSQVSLFNSALSLSMGASTAPGNSGPIVNACYVNSSGDLFCKNSVNSSPALNTGLTGVSIGSSGVISGGRCMLFDTQDLICTNISLDPLIFQGIKAFDYETYSSSSKVCAINQDDLVKCY